MNVNKLQFVPEGVLSAGSGVYAPQHPAYVRQYIRHGVCVHACEIDIMIYVSATLR